MVALNEYYPAGELQGDDSHLPFQWQSTQPHWKFIPKVLTVA